VTSNPSAGVSGSVPVSASVNPFAVVDWQDCLYGIINPVQGDTCASTLRIASNSDISVRVSATSLQNGIGRRLLSSYQIRPPVGNAFAVSHDTNTIGQVYQVAAPLGATSQYTITGTARNDPASTMAGVYTGQLVVTLVAASTDMTAPTGLAVTPGNMQLTATWNPASGATGYEVGYNTGATFNPATAIIVSATGTSATLTGLTNGQVYSLAVRSVVGGTRSGWSAPVQGTPQAAGHSLYRDARDFANVHGGCFSGKWLYMNRTNRNECTDSNHSNANGIKVLDRPNNSPATTNINNILPAGTYTLWALANRIAWGSSTPDNARLTATHGTATFTAMPPVGHWNTTGIAWIRLGTLAVDPAQPFGFSGTGLVTSTGVVLRGIYLTTGPETPVCAPSGFGGDQRTC
jgi:hypothetical protein